MTFDIDPPTLTIRLLDSLRNDLCPHAIAEGGYCLALLADRRDEFPCLIIAERLHGVTLRWISGGAWPLEKLIRDRP